MEILTGHGQTVLWHAATKCEAHCMARHEPFVAYKKLESKLKHVSVSGVNWSTGAYKDDATMFFFVFLYSPGHSDSFSEAFDIPFHTYAYFKYFKRMTGICVQHVTHFPDLQASGAWWECMRCWTRFGQHAPSLAQHVTVLPDV